MTPEREPRSQLLTIEDVAGLAREIMLRDGTHVPLVILESDTTTLATILDPMPDTHLERWNSFYMMGFTLGENSQLESIRQVFFVTEAWMTSAAPDCSPTLPPSQDPQRLEVLTIAHYDAEMQRSHLLIYEMVRQEGQLVDLHAHSENEKLDNEVHNPLLTGLVRGFERGKEKRR